MLKAKVKTTGSFRRPKASLGQKVVKKLVNETGRAIIKKLKPAVVKVSGAFKTSLAMKMISKKNKSWAIIGAKSSYVKKTKKEEKRPAFYAHMVEAKYQYFAKAFTPSDLNSMRAKVKAAIDQGFRK